jgi:hypothetical protein
MGLQAYHVKTGQAISYGDPVTDFRGETATFVKATRAAAPGKSGKVYVSWTNTEGVGSLEYYDKVFDLTVKQV